MQHHSRVTNIPDNNKFFNIITFIKHLRNCKSNYISKNKENNKSLSLIISIKYLYTQNNKKNNLKSKVAIIFTTISTKYLAQCKTIYIIVKSNLNKK